MTSTVFKYQFGIYDDVVLKMPANARILSFRNQNETPTIWALVNSDLPEEFRTFRLAGTGHDLDDMDKLKYIGTDLFMNGELVFHLFEKFS